MSRRKHQASNAADSARARSRKAVPPRPNRAPRSNNRGELNELEHQLDLDFLGAEEVADTEEDAEPPQVEVAADPAFVDRLNEQFEEIASETQNMFRKRDQAKAIAFINGTLKPHLRSMMASSKEALHYFLASVYAVGLVLAQRRAGVIQNRKALLKEFGSAGGRGEKVFLIVLNGFGLPAAGGIKRKRVQTRYSTYNVALMKAQELGLAPSELLKRLREDGGIDRLAGRERVPAQIAAAEVEPDGRSGVSRHDGSEQADRRSRADDSDEQRYRQSGRGSTTWSGLDTVEGAETVPAEKEPPGPRLVLGKAAKRVVMQGDGSYSALIDIEQDGYPSITLYRIRPRPDRTAKAD